VQETEPTAPAVAETDATDADAEDSEFVALIETSMRGSALNPAPTPTAAGGSSGSGETTKIDGKIKLNGQFYKTQCSCKDVAGDGSQSSARFAEKNDGQPKCMQPPSKIRVRQEAFNRKLGLSVEVLHALLGRPQDVTYAKVDDTSFACIDGRETDPVLATPGGDFGEFLLALAEYETMTKRSFSQIEVQKILTAWLDWAPRGPRPLYFHTDEAAIRHLQHNLHYNGQKGKVVGLDLESPKAEYQTELLKDLPAPQNQGCYYLKAILDNPARFYMRKELLPALIQSYYKILWDKVTLSSDGTKLYQKLNFVVHQGEPAEKAWVNFRTSTACEHHHRAPLFRPFPLTAQRPGTGPLAPVFVNHPQAVSVVRTRLAKFFGLFNPVLSEREFLNKLNHRGNTYMEITAEMLGSQVPYYTVSVE